MRVRRVLLAVGVAFGLVAAPGRAQQARIADRVAALRDGVLELRFPARPGICGDGKSYIRSGEHTRFGSWSSGERERPCVPGPVRVALSVANGEVRHARAYVGPPVPGSSDEVLETSAVEASQYLLALARRSGSRAGDDLVFGAVLGEKVVAWPALLEIARAKRSRGSKGHQAAIFWLGRYASAKTAGSDDPFDEFDDEGATGDDDLKEHAVFLLSQLKDREGVDALIGIARTNPDPHVRSKAIFWLGESGDPRAIDVFEEILRGR